MTKQEQWNRIKAEWPELGEFLIAWSEHSVRDKRNRPIKPEKMGKVKVLSWPKG